MTGMTDENVEEVYEVAYRVLRDGNLFEWVQNEMDVDLHDTWEKLKARQEAGADTPPIGKDGSR
jgi:hypothetical protein